MIKEHRAGTLKKTYETIVEDTVFTRSSKNFTEKEDYIFHMASIKNSEFFTRPPLKIKALFSALIPVLFAVIYKLIVTGG